MEYKEALEYIHGSRKFGCKLGLENIKTLLDMLGNPHKGLKYVHIAGTNGKGSTVAFISSILIEGGYKTGTFISPYIERFTERIGVNKKEISQDDLARITEKVKENVDEMLNKGLRHPTEFEIVTAIAFLYYQEQECDIVILETGLGGRFDSTNVINSPLVSVITSISRDHMTILGDTLSQIAFEKAGIIKNNCETVLYPQEREVEQVIERVCKDRNSLLYRVKLEDIKGKEYSIEGQTFDYGKYKKLRIKLLGSHQLKNAALALESCNILKNKGFNITEENIVKGLEETSWPGRMEIVCNNPLVLIDGAHNTDGIKSLAENINKYFSNKKKIFIMGILKDKEYRGMVEIIAPLADKIITVTPPNERALSAIELAESVKPYCKNVVISDTIKNGMAEAIKTYEEDDIICAFGSLYYIGEIRQYCQQPITKVTGF